MNFFGEVSRDPRTYRLDLGDDPDSFVDHESFSRIGLKFVSKHI